MRLFAAIAILFVVILIGLWIFGEMMRPKTQLIEQEAVRAGEVQP